MRIRTVVILFYAVSAIGLCVVWVPWVAVADGTMLYCGYGPIWAPPAYEHEDLRATKVNFGAVFLELFGLTVFCATCYGFAGGRLLRVTKRTTRAHGLPEVEHGTSEDVEWRTGRRTQDSGGAAARPTPSEKIFEEGDIVEVRQLGTWHRGIASLRGGKGVIALDNGHTLGTEGIDDLDIRLVRAADSDASDGRHESQVSRPAISPGSKSIPLYLQICCAIALIAAVAMFVHAHVRWFGSLTQPAAIGRLLGALAVSMLVGFLVVAVLSSLAWKPKRGLRLLIGSITSTAFLFFRTFAISSADGDFRGFAHDLANLDISSDIRAQIQAMSDRRTEYGAASSVVAWLKETVDKTDQLLTETATNDLNATAIVFGWLNDYVGWVDRPRYSPPSELDRFIAIRRRLESDPEFRSQAFTALAQAGVDTSQFSHIGKPRPQVPQMLELTPEMTMDDIIREFRHKCTLSRSDLLIARDRLCQAAVREATLQRQYDAVVADASSRLARLSLPADIRASMQEGFVQSRAHGLFKAYLCARNALFLSADSLLVSFISLTSPDLPNSQVRMSTTADLERILLLMRAYNNAYRSDSLAQSQVFDGWNKASGSLNTSVR